MPPAKDVHSINVKSVAGDRQMPGRPTLYTEETVSEICDALRAGNTRNTAARYAGISRMTFNNWMRDPEKPEFAIAIEEAEARHQVGLVLQMTAISQGRQAARPGQMDAIKFLLERRHHNDWKERTETTFRVEEEVDVETLERKFNDALEARRLLELASGVDGTGTSLVIEGLANVGAN